MLPLHGQGFYHLGLPLRSRPNSAYQLTPASANKGGGLVVATPHVEGGKRKKSQWTHCRRFELAALQLLRAFDAVFDDVMPAVGGAQFLAQQSAERAQISTMHRAS